MWSKKHAWANRQALLDVSTDSNKMLLFNISLLWFKVLNPFLGYIKFHMIPARILMTDIHPLGLVPHM